MRAAQTGKEPVALSAMEQLVPKALRLYNDEVAYQTLTIDMKFYMQLCKLPFFRKWIINISEKMIPGAYASLLLRKHFIDQKLLDKKSEVFAVVELGAGFDTRSVRFCGICNFPFFELDFPNTMRAKKARIQKFNPSALEKIKFCGIDFDRDNILDTLQSHGLSHNFNKSVFFICEGVTPYLTESGIQKTFEYLKSATKGSYLAFTYIDENFINGSNLMGWEAAYKQYVKSGLWKSGFSKETCHSFLNQYGWKLLEDKVPQEIAPVDILRKRKLQTSDVERLAFAIKQF